MPSPRIDLTGRTFGQLLVREFDRIFDKSAYWLCDCECGAKLVSVKATRLIRGLTAHCGCLGYRLDRDRHVAARAKVAPAIRRRIAKLGAKARLARQSP